MTLHFRVWCGPASVGFRNRGIIIVLICEQNCPGPVSWFSCLCTSYPVWCTSCLKASEPLSACAFNFGDWFSLALTNVWWTFTISEKYKVFTSTRFSHFTFSYLFIMNLKYFVTIRHHSGALISSMRQILNNLLGKLLQVYRCLKQDKDWNIFRNFRFLDTDLAWVVSLSDLQNNNEARLRPLTQHLFILINVTANWYPNEFRLYTSNTVLCSPSLAKWFRIYKPSGDNKMQLKPLTWLSFFVFLVSK